MKKIIEIDLINKEDFFEKYNHNEVSRDLINYIVKQTLIKRKDKNLQIIINNKCEIDNVVNLLREGIEKEYEFSHKKLKYNNLFQLIFIILGTFALFLATLLKDNIILNEIIIIGAWVLIWESIDLELFSETKQRGRRKILKRILKSEIIENKSLED